MSNNEKKMSYQEFQVWYHTFHMAYPNVVRHVNSSTAGLDETARVADAVLAKFKTVDMSKEDKASALGLDQSTLSGIVKEAMKKVSK